MRLRSATMPAQQPNGVLEPREPPSLTAWKNSAKVLWLNHGKSQAGRAPIGGWYHPTGLRTGKICRFVAGTLAGQPLIRVTLALALGSRAGLLDEFNGVPFALNHASQFLLSGR